MNSDTEPLKIEDANCSQNSIERPEERRPPRYKYSLRLATMAAAEKQPKANAQPTKAPTTMLQKGINCDYKQSSDFNQRRIGKEFNQITTFKYYC